VVTGVFVLATSASSIATAADTTTTPTAVGLPASTDPDLAQAVAARKAYGLVADAATVAALMASSADVGSAEVGIPMTRDEVTALDINGRNAFVAAASN
jgi:hypothetical protein